jgi:hypothetical protein
VREAELAQSSAELGQAQTCSELTRLSERICTSSAGLCQLAEQLVDADALARCEQARNTCLGAHERTRKACATSAQDDP